MSDVTAPSTDQIPLSTDSVELELSNLVKHETAKSISPTEKNAERIRISLARLSSTSIEDLEALTAELKRMQDFVKSEVDGVQRQIEGALAGISIIVETIAPWKNTSPPAALTNPRSFRPGLAASIDSTPGRRVAGGG
jgi:hypothetical protein